MEKFEKPELIDMDGWINTRRNEKFWKACLDSNG